MTTPGGRKHRSAFVRPVICMKKFWVVCWLGFLRKTNCVEKMVANCYGILLLIIGRGGTADISRCCWQVTCAKCDITRGFFCRQRAKLRKSEVRGQQQVVHVVTFCRLFLWGCLKNKLLCRAETIEFLKQLCLVATQLVG